MLPSRMLSSSKGVEGAAKEFEARKRLQAEALGEGRKRQAPPMLTALLAAIEKVVVDETVPLFIRAYGWYRLLRHWTAMRFDDGNGLHPSSLTLRARGLVGLLTRTKTSGADKGSNVLPIYVSKDAFLELAWLEPGLSLWTNELGFPRDYLLVLPNEDFSGTCGKKAKYSDAQGFSRALLAMLKAPDGSPLLLEESLGFWSEHSDRAGLDSWLSAISVSADLRRFVGRWSARGSEDVYVRTATRVVENCQRLAALHARASHSGGPDFLGEEETLAQLRCYLAAMGVADDQVDAQVRNLTMCDTSLPTDPLGSMSASGSFHKLESAIAATSSSSAALPALLDLAIEEESENDNLEQAEAEIAGVVDVAEALALQDELDSPSPQGFVVSHTRGGHCRRLHFAGRCFRVPGEHYKQFRAYGQDYPAEHLYDLRCKDCFPAGKVAARAAEEQELQSDSDGSSSSASADEEEAEGPE